MRENCWVEVACLGSMTREDRRPKFGLTVIIVYLLIQTYFIKVKMTSVFPTQTLNLESAPKSQVLPPMHKYTKFH